MSGSTPPAASELTAWLSNARRQLVPAREFRGLRYRTRDVNAFLGTIADALRRGERPDPERVQSARFSLTRTSAGYDPRAVDALLDELQHRLRNDAPPGEAAFGDLDTSAVEAIQLIRNARFGTTRRGGYDDQEVDTFLDEVMAVVLRGDRLKAEQIRAQFSIVRWRPGYAPRDVDAWLQRLQRYASGDGAG